MTALYFRHRFGTTRDTPLLSIKQTTTGDLDVLASIYLNALQENPDENWTPAAARALLADWFRRQPDLFFTGYVDGRIAGAFVVGVRPWWDGNHLVDGELFVDPKFQNQGVAGQLVRHTLIVAQEKYRPLKNWDTYTFRNDEFPLTWYRRLGFAEISEWVMIRADINAVLENLQ